MSKVYKIEDLLNKNGHAVEVSFLAAVTGLKEGEGRGSFDAFIEEGKQRDGYEISLSINGFELDFADIVKRWKEQYDHMLREKAKVLLKERADDVSEKLTDFLDGISRRLDEMVDEFDLEEN